MKLLSTYFVAPAMLAALSVLVGCSSDSPSPGAGGAAGASAAGAASAGKGGSAGASAGSGGSGVAGASAGAAGSPSTAGGGSGGGTSAGAGGGGGDVIPATFNTVREMIRLTPCTGGGCHGEEGVPLHWTADDPNLHQMVTTHTTKNCGKLVNTASPADSGLIKLLLGDCGVAPNRTERMPYKKCYDGDPQDYPCVAPEIVSAVQAWIVKGAPAQ